MRTLPPGGFFLLTLALVVNVRPIHADDAAALEIVKARCLRCHSADKKRGELDLSQRAKALAGGELGPAFLPGKADASLLLKRVLAGEMPPQKKLADAEIQQLKQWIDHGAVYPKTSLVDAPTSWWSLQPLSNPEVPVASGPHDWARNPIDCFIAAKLEKNGLRPSGEVDRASWLRRVSFDLIGLPPTPEELLAFLHDTRSGAYERQVDRLLASPAYGERWARHWLDVVRFADSHGYETNALRPNAWPYRDYVIRAFNRDVPYPQFVMEQLAGDTIPGADLLARAATGFLVAGAHDTVGIATVEGMLQQRMDDLDDIVSNTAATFTGLTVGCARCHDHKFDPIPQRDYYRMQAIFAGVRHDDRDIPVDDAAGRQAEAAACQAELNRIDLALDRAQPLADPRAKSPKRAAVNARRNVEIFEPVSARKVRLVVEKTTDGSEPCIDELEIYTAGPAPRNVALESAGALATASSTFPDSTIHRLQHVNDGAYGNSHSWISNERGKGWIQVKLPGKLKIDRIIWGRDREEKFKDRLAQHYRIEVETSPEHWRVVASSRDRYAHGKSAPHSSPTEEASLLAQADQVRARLAELQPTQRVYAGAFAKPEPTFLLVRGDPMRKKEPVTPGALSAVRPGMELPASSAEGERRRALANWIANPANPLTARVLVNRLWQYHFGVGMVGTPSDFGRNGEQPTHPELLDWLAGEFMHEGWQLKPLHRLIVLSATYRQSSQVDPVAQSVDRQNRLLSRQTPRRLEAEAVRDAMLSVDGQLNSKMGGPGYFLWEKDSNYVVVFRPRAHLGAAEDRRMVYQFQPRSQRDPIFGLFDCPDGSLAKPRRATSTTALQALNLLNSAFIEDQAVFLAKRLEREAGPDVVGEIQRAFLLAFGRPATPTETLHAESLVHRFGLPAFCRALFNANEFVYVD
jgi:hypothetical protein